MFLLLLWKFNLIQMKKCFFTRELNKNKANFIQQKRNHFYNYFGDSKKKKQHMLARIPLTCSCIILARIASNSNAVIEYAKKVTCTSISETDYYFEARKSTHVYN